MRPLSPTARWVGASLFVAAAGALVALAVTLSNLQEPQPLRFRMDLAARGTPLQTVTVYLVEPDSLTLVPVTREVVREDNVSRMAEELVAHLSEDSLEGTAPLPPGTRLLHFFVERDGDAVLDFNQNVLGIEARGIREERLRLSALARTFLDNLSGVERLHLLVHGRPLDRWGARLELSGPVEDALP